MQVRADAMTQQVLQLEQHLIDGSYGELLHARQQQQPSREEEVSRRKNINSTSSSTPGVKIGEEKNQRGSVAASTLPPSSQVFIDKLVRTVRLKVAACMEKAHNSVDVAYAVQALGLANAAELQQFVLARNSSGTHPPDILFDYMGMPADPAAAAAAVAAAAAGGGGATGGGGRGDAAAAAAAAAANALAAGMGSCSFASALSFATTPEPRVVWKLEKDSLIFVKKEETSTHAQQHCSLQAMQLLGSLISK